MPNIFSHASRAASIVPHILCVQPREHRMIGKIARLGNRDQRRKAAAAVVVVEEEDALHRVMRKTSFTITLHNKMRRDSRTNPLQQLVTFTH